MPHRYNPVMFYLPSDPPRHLESLKRYTGWRPVAKLLGVLWALLQAGLVVHRHFPAFTQEQKLAQIQRWCQNLLRILEVDVVCEQPLAFPDVALVVSNHISWLDILVIQSLMPGVMVAKSEVRGWPLIGALAQASGTIFVDRASLRATRGMVGDTVAALHQGLRVIGFPEGTSSDGSDVNAFFANLFDGAIQTGQEVQPLALRYVHGMTRVPHTAVAFVGNASLLASLRRVVCASPITSRVCLGERIASVGHSRKTLASQSHQSVCGKLSRQRHRVEANWWPEQLIW